ncbi:MAG TPA: alpha/beta fold hydrolase [Ohtaekwangia sp.]|uniref:alpha/beta hydrolase n=1 Tax=Ohtaekwangia sp. TaxID=2066019 RepID=UPI002F92CBEE
MESIATPVKVNTTVTPSSKKPRIPWSMRMIRKMFPVLETVAPRYARSLFVRMFFSPWKFAIPEAEQTILQRSDTFILDVEGKAVQVYRWGKGPVIVLVHGWAGRAGQFRSFIEHFAANGYQVIAFDAPAHGRSSGKQTNIVEFKDAILALEKRVETIHAVIAHSIGGAASLFALAEGLNTATLITLATPADADEILREFGARVQASAKAVQHLRDYIYHTFSRPFEELTAIHFAKQIQSPMRWLVVHDMHDKEIAVRNATLITAAYPQATLKITEGLGHVRILRDEATIQMCLEFVEQSR